MPFVLPYYKRRSQIRKIRRRYKDVEHYQGFTLQTLCRGKPGVNRPACRILASAFERLFVIAVGSDIKGVRDEEWGYVTKDFPLLIPTHVDLTSLNRWALAHFITKAIKERHATKFEALSLTTDSDEEDDYDDSDTDAGRPSSLDEDLNGSKSDRKSIFEHKISVLTIRGRIRLIVAILFLNMTFVGAHFAPTDVLRTVLLCVTSALLALLWASQSSALSIESIASNDCSDEKRAVWKDHKKQRTSSTSTKARRRGAKPERKQKLIKRCPSTSIVEGLGRKSRKVSFPPTRWNPSDATAFFVRGPLTKSTGEKIHSMSSMFEVAGLDLFKCRCKVDNIGSFVPLPLPMNLSSAKQDMWRKELERRRETLWFKDSSSLPSYFVVNLQFPDYDPPMVFDQTDGFGYSLVIYLVRKICGRTRDGDNNGLSKIDEGTEGSDGDEDEGGDNKRVEGLASKEDDIDDCAAGRLWSRFIHSNLDGTSRQTMKGRFKCICKVGNAEELNLGTILRNTLKKFNGKPFLAAPCQRYYEGRDYLEVDIDVHEFSYLARKGVRSVRSYIKDFDVDLAFLVEGRDSDELPERLLGSVKVSKMIPETAPWLDDLYELPEHEKEKWKKQKGASA
eukprot:g1411.t1